MVEGVQSISGPLGAMSDLVFIEPHAPPHAMMVSCHIDVMKSTEDRIVWLEGRCGNWVRIKGQSFKVLVVLMHCVSETNRWSIICANLAGKELFSIRLTSLENMTWLQGRLAMASGLKAHLYRCGVPLRPKFFVDSFGAELTTADNDRSLGSLFSVQAPAPHPEVPVVTSAQTSGGGVTGALSSTNIRGEWRTPDGQVFTIDGCVRRSHWAPR